VKFPAAAWRPGTGGFVVWCELWSSTLGGVLLVKAEASERRYSDISGKNWLRFAKNGSVSAQKRDVINNPYTEYIGTRLGEILGNAEIYSRMGLRSRTPGPFSPSCSIKTMPAASSAR